MTSASSAVDIASATLRDGSSLSVMTLRDTGRAEWSSRSATGRR
jgi:hypothetical protein